MGVHGPLQARKVGGMLVASCRLSSGMVILQGWEWLNEGKNGRHKWGYISTVPGTSMEILVRL